MQGEIPGRTTNTPAGRSNALTAPRQLVCRRSHGSYRPAVVASDHPPSAGISKVAPAISSKVELPEARVVRPVKDRPVEPPKIAAEKIPSAVREGAGGEGPRSTVVPPPVPPPAPAERWSEEVAPSRPSSAAADAVVVWPAAADQEQDAQPPFDDGLLRLVNEPAAPPVAGPPVPLPPPPLDLSAAIADEPAAPLWETRFPFPDSPPGRPSVNVLITPRRRRGFPNGGCR